MTRSSHLEGHEAGSCSSCTCEELFSASLDPLLLGVLEPVVAREDKHLLEERMEDCDLSQVPRSPDARVYEDFRSIQKEIKRRSDRDSS